MRIRLKKKWSEYEVGRELDPVDSLARKLIAEDIAEALDPPVVETATAEPTPERAVRPKAAKRKRRKKRATLRPVVNTSGTHEESAVVVTDAGL